jgi:hypothetical protein
MARPTTDVQICNLALDLVKEQPITGFSSPTDKVSALCARWYPLMREATLSAYNWNFALKSRAAARIATPEVSDYTDAYQLPNDYLKLRAIIDPEIPLGRRRYEIQGRQLFYNNGGEATLDIWYTKDETDVATYPALYIMLLSHRLALVLGKKLTARSGIMADIKADLQMIILQARNTDGQIRPPKIYESSRIVNAGLNVSASAGAAGDYEFEDGMDE